MRRTLLFWLVFSTLPGIAAADDRDDQRTMKILIEMRGAPCGAISGTARDPKTDGIIAQCTNGIIYGGVRTNDGRGWVLGQRNSLTGAWAPY